MKPIRFLESAEAEMEEAISYFETQAARLGERFRDDVEETVARIARHPDIGRRLSRRVRSFRVRTFTYNIIYAIVNDELTIVAIAHHKRRPRYWRSRLDGL